MPFFIKRNDKGEIANVRYVFALDGTEFEDFCDRGIVTVVALDGTPVTDADRKLVAEQFGHYLEGDCAQFPLD